MLQNTKTGDNDAVVMIQHDSTDVDTHLRNFRRQEFLEPEKKLLSAVLEDALACLDKYFHASSKRGKKSYQEAEDWVFRREDSGVFSFTNVCEAVGLQPSYVRKGVLRWKEQNLRCASKKVVDNDLRAGAAPRFVFKRPRRRPGINSFR
jgi:hypothetical protein